MSKGLGLNQPIFYNGIVENRNDPLELGRVRVRVFGIHSDSVTDIPTDKLPWCPVVLPANNASNSGIGWSPNGIVEGTQVLVYFADGMDFQKPVVIGTVPALNSVTSTITSNADSVVIPPSTNQDPLLQSTPTIASTWILGQTSEKFETKSGANSGYISSGIGDAGGKSYGPWQISLNVGTLATYIKNHCIYKSEFTGMVIGDPAFDAKWKSIGNSDRSAAFKEDQKKFIQDTHYAVLLRSLSDLGLADRGNGVQDCIWSVAVQYGANTTIIQEALGGKQINALTDADVVNLIQMHRKNTVRTKFKSSPTLWTSLEARADNEKASLLALCDDKTTSLSKQVNAPSSKDVYGQDVYRPIDMSKVSSTASKTSFKDPSGKYPTKLYKGLADTNRLARNYKSNTTIVKVKQNSTIKGNGFSEPMTRYNAVYPFNKVFESESGHIMEFDDTAGAERVHIYHRAGTFIEFHPDGTIVRKSMKDDVEVVVANKSCYVAGDCNVVIEGNSKLKVLGNMTAQVQNNIDFVAGGNISMTAGGSLTLSGALATRVLSGVSASMEAPSVSLLTGTSNPVQLDLFEKINSQLAMADEEVPPYPEDDSTEFTTNQNAEYLPAIDSAATTTVIAITETQAVIDEAALGTQFSKHYVLADLTTNVALQSQRNKVVDQCGLTADEITLNLQTLARWCLDPIADRFGKDSFVITNAFRLANGGTSHHLSGCAVDLQFIGLKVSEYPIIAERIRQILPKYSQIILEYHGMNPVIHIGYASEKASSPFSRITGDTKDVFSTYDVKFTRFKTVDGKGGLFDKNRNLIFAVGKF